MFRGDHPELRRTVARARTAAAELDHPRVGSEHLLLALTAPGHAAPGHTAAAAHTVGALLGRYGGTEQAIRTAVRRAAPLGAGAAADRDLLAPLGVDVAGLLSRLSPSTLDRTTRPEPLLPFGAARARRRCARANPPFGLDAQAAYEASLRLALARRDREHRPEHLALALVALDPGVAWALEAAAVDRPTLLTELAAAFPAPARNPLLRAERRIGQRSRGHDLIRRYQHTTGRTVTSAGAVATLICP
ncbi:Clp protease N-terminal domain-containing protein [Micromonospora sp. WMMD1102]|uniref:Clp protease N-terminal domain-containing protein n=1 Tax=Micromonospora sp. WMMD1102 TaxID=3016105 RepID=UPI002414F81A|nr:Clp protease N-terminal domain-containing protein [Micromonospora sp. WMMD1102]MDG4790826.1 Clp protease N-terminal domain-containing protein [Micromonospora sp. WMMD1102]